ncbi:MAG: AMP-binding protein, partial [Acidobacteriota bacterium]
MPSRTVFAVLAETTARQAELPALYQPFTEGGARKYRVYTWAQYKQAAEEIAVGLRGLGIGKGDVVALDSETRAEFYLADLGILANGSVAAALYTSYPIGDRARTIRACEAKAVFVEDPETLLGLREAADPALRVRWILLTGSADGAISLEELRQRGRHAIAAEPDLFTRIQAEVTPEDPAILYLTSGATGEPKMGMVSHAALVANMDMGPAVLDLGPRDATLAFLPSAHITQRMVMELLPIRWGVPVWFVESLMKLPQEIELVRPTFFVAPPRLWERIYASIATEIRKRG